MSLLCARRSSGVATLRDIAYIVRHREHPARLGRFAILCVKRLHTLPALLLLTVRAWRLRRAGAHVGHLCFIGHAVFDGPAHRLTIGDETSLGRCTITLHADVHIGRRVVISDGVTILTASHDLRDPMWTQTAAPISIGDYAWIAQGAMLLPGVTIGTGAVVAAGAVVRTSVPPYALAIGNPATLRENARSRDLRYMPTRLTAAYEAWLGPARSVSGASDAAANTSAASPRTSPHEAPANGPSQAERS